MKVYTVHISDIIERAAGSLSREAPGHLADVRWAATNKIIIANMTADVR